MNIAPYIVARRMSWIVPDNSICQSRKKFVWENWNQLNLLSRKIEFLKKPIIVGKSNNLFDGAMGLCLVEKNDFEVFLSKFSEEENVSRGRNRFYSGLFFRKNSQYLIFPDDLSDRPNISFVSLRYNKDGFLSFGTVQYDLNLPENSISDLTVIEGEDCSIAISGDFPERSFFCFTSGCSECCVGEKVARGDLYAFYCSCKPC